MSKHQDNKNEASDELASLLGEQDPTFAMPNNTQRSTPSPEKEEVEEVVEVEPKQTEGLDGNGIPLSTEPSEEIPSDDDDLKKEIEALSAEEFSEEKPKEDDGTDWSELEEFSPEDYTNKEKIPAIREDNRKKSLEAKRLREEKIQYESQLEELQAKVQDYEQKVKSQEPVVNAHEDPEWQRINTEVVSKAKAFDNDLMLTTGSSIPLASGERFESLFTEYQQVNDDAQSKREFLMKASLELMGKSDSITDNIIDGEWDIKSTLSELEPDERISVTQAIKSLDGVLSFASESSSKLRKIEADINENSGKYLAESRIKKYEESSTSFRESLKGVGILDEQAVESDPNSFSAFIHERMSDPKNKGNIESAIKMHTEYKHGRPQISEKVYESFELEGKDRKYVDKMADEAHSKRVASMDKEIHMYLSNRELIQEAVRQYNKAQKKAELKKKEKKQVSSAETLPTRKESTSKDSGDVDHLASLLNFNPRR